MQGLVHGGWEGAGAGGTDFSKGSVHFSSGISERWV